MTGRPMSGSFGRPLVRDVLHAVRHPGRAVGHLQRWRLLGRHYVTLGPELYAVVRALRPRVVVETGVASGVSSAHILQALAVNGAGTLYSIDLPNVQEGSVLANGRQAGWIVPDVLRRRWVLLVGDSRQLLPQVLGSLDHVDVFVHDSEHSRECMTFEYEQAFPKLVTGGVLMSDDPRLHPAWDDFCRRRGLRPTRVGRLGVTRKRSFA